jgi:DMSO/TMAO reductase YedYZ molybdopterin-dependent catalytic subunit
MSAPDHAVTGAPMRRPIKPFPFNAETRVESLEASVTPPGRHYVRSNFAVPDLPPDTYRLVVDGAVRTPVTLDLAALRAMPAHELAVTMECAGNDRLGMRPVPAGEPWASGAVGTAVWGGVRLRDVLLAAGVRADACELVVTGADRGPRDDARTPGDVSFARGLPLEVALHEDTLLALTMHGAPLPPEHGAPVRLIVPGWYGMASVKWVTSLQVVTEPFTGYFQRDRYVYDEAGAVRPVTRMLVKSLITTPTDGGEVPLGPVTVRGWAWSGSGRIARVEFSGNGTTWQEATLEEPAGAHAWTPWTCRWQPEQPGRAVLQSRATDVTGATQPDAITWNRLGYGNNAVRPVVVDVRAAG